MVVVKEQARCEYAIFLSFLNFSYSQNLTVEFMIRVIIHGLTTLHQMLTLLNSHLCKGYQMATDSGATN